MEFDFSECEFINDEMKIYTFIDFCKNAKAIKSLFDKLSRNGKLFYMWYLYANIHLTMNQKNKSWDYLNGYCEIIDLISLV